MRRNLYIIGAGGLAREMAMLAEIINERQYNWAIKGFISDDRETIEQNIRMANIVGDDQWLLELKEEADLVVGIGTPSIRAKALKPYLGKADKYRYPNLIHPSANLDLSRIHLGQGNAVMAGCSFTCDIWVGNYNLFSPNSTIGHDTIIGDYNVINPGVNISGRVTLGDKVLLGTGSRILENLTIGSNVTVGAGGVVTKDLPDGVTVVGVPARPLHQRF